MDPKLYKAATSGDISFLDRMTGDQESSLVSQLTPKMNNVLHIAAEFKETEFLKKVYEKCPTLIRQTNSKGDTPLHVAARVGCVDIVDFLFASPDDIESTLAETLKDLLQMKNAEKDAALHCAIRNRHYFVAKSLIVADSKLANSANAADESLLYLASAQGSMTILDLILDHSPPSSSRIYRGPSGITAMHASTLRFVKAQCALKKLVDKRPQMIGEGDIFRRTPLHYAAYFDFVEAAQMFLKHDSSAAYVLDDNGESSLHIAAFRGHVNMIDELIKCNPDSCELVDDRGRTFLHAAVVGGRENVVKYVLENPKLFGLINEQDKDGNTPLHLAVLVENYKIVRKLAQDNRVQTFAINKEFLTACSIYWNFRKSGFADEKIRYLLKRLFSIQDVQQRIETELKRLKEAPINEDLSVTRATQEIYNPDNSAERKKIMLEMNVLTAVLISTVTFAAIFTMPGGYKSEGPDQGMATLQHKAAFKAFVIFDTFAFCFSIFAVWVQSDTSFYRLGKRFRYYHISSWATTIAILAMVLTFASSLYVMLENSTALAMAAYLVIGALMLAYLVGWFVDPAAIPFPVPGSIPLRKKVLKLWLQYGII